MPPSRNRLRPRRLPPEIREAPGNWVAMKDGKVVAIRPTPDELIMELREKGIRGATMLRAPAETDVELVGLG